MPPRPKVAPNPNIPALPLGGTSASAAPSAKVPLSVFGSRGCSIPRTEERAITLNQLKIVFAKACDRCSRERWCSTAPGRGAERLTRDTINLYDLVTLFLRPVTQERQVSLVELIADGPQPPDWFVSHWWGEPVKDFIACLRRHLMDRGLPENTTYWVCAYALRQHALGLELAGGVEVSPFMRALQLTQGTVSVVDKMGYYFTRVWCGYELNESIMSHDSRYLHDIYAAADAKNVYGGAVHAVGLVDGFGVEDCDVLGNNSTEHKQRREANFPLDLVLKSSSFDVEQAEASQPEDKANILALVGKQAHALNATMRTRFGASRLADMLQDGAGSDPDAAAKREEDLTAMLSWLSASNLRKLAVYATHGYASAKAVERLVDSLPKTLVELRAECLRPECVPGVRKLVHRGQLETLELKACFLSPQDARRICEALVPKLGAKPKLKTLNLANNNLGAEGAKAVAECLVKNATVRDLNLMINNISDDGAGALALMLKENTALTSLNLIFNMITDNGASRLADGLRTNGVLAKLNVRCVPRRPRPHATPTRSSRLALKCAAPSPLPRSRIRARIRINRMDSPGVAALRAAWIVRPGKHNREHLVYDTEQSEEQGAAAASGLGMHDDDISSYKSSAKYDDDAPWYEDLTDIMRNK